ncbi:MAG: GntR family transcriptional regulator [Pseudomonadota bacterium]
MSITAQKKSAAPPDLHARLIAQLRDLIVRGELPPSSRVPETRLCERFHVSRTPLREALKALSAEGLVMLRPNRGSVITPLDPATLVEIFEAKGALERFIGLNATTRASEAELMRLSEVHAALADAASLKDTATYTELNEQFHTMLAQLARNSAILDMYGRLQLQILRARYRVNADHTRIEGSLAEHEGIMTAVLARARLDAAERLVLHNEATAREVLKRI